MNDDEDNATSEISVGINFNTIKSTDRRLCFIDTPGVNNALDTSQRRITQKLIAGGEFDSLVYILDPTNLGNLFIR